METHHRFHLLHSVLPELQPKQSFVFSIRLIEAEHSQIDQIAKRLNLHSSLMACHTLLTCLDEIWPELNLYWRDDSISSIIFAGVICVSTRRKGSTSGCIR